MAFTTEVTDLGDNKVYRLSDNIKKYTLKDVGFVESKAGNFVLERSLDPESPYQKSVKLKMMVSKDLGSFKLATVTANGLQNINIFKNETHEKLVEQFNHLIEVLEEREVVQVQK
ncbi:DUF1831 domain-containing protein [Secundilactobacillus malefermentans]|uniref:Cysteine desulfurase n=1 Tax=Secundilactobacillus malefermentans TaxID=176292 RepID=A0A4R5NKD1_9LACO|nr:DUF1831 domain-containing protein [Secundilactobacillus malefermentans]KRM60095.1 hypothetical protein FD44_GL000657 [Secundilactobacillus malefermentans DSM 5705 = KCTC 3548]QEA30870.1 cysteine desulfurase [Secundilactobacillus malefermentans]TDG75102.1 hypothetical protein C5L31_000979 [Secundilactobacillus malefermentans]